ncbi:DUF2240 family protein [Natronorarus salvus]|uniref:DUF2240 family protein n=1 Tax=Natronorarus salvus TaxID=3117733 RepID=UPI002F26BD8D
MSLRVAVAAPYKRAGTETIEESAFVVALSLDRDWFSPDQSKRLIDVAVGQGLLERTEDGLRVTFAPSEVTIPEGFSPDEELLSSPSVFERVLDALVATGIEKQRAVAGINELQAERGVTIETAAVLYAHRRGVDVGEEVRMTREILTGERER